MNATIKRFGDLQWMQVFRRSSLLAPGSLGNRALITGLALALISLVLTIYLQPLQAQSSKSPWLIPSRTAKQQDSPPTGQSASGTLQKVRKTPQQWRKQLTAAEFEVTRQKGTEQPYSGKYWNNKQDGVYTCKCCGHPLFDSKQKYKSGTGWPSYIAPKAKLSVSYIVDYSDQMVRTEVTCRRCDAHLGHVFDDGPQPTGKRFCMNSVALSFVQRAQWIQRQRKRFQPAGGIPSQSQPVDPRDARSSDAAVADRLNNKKK